MLYLLQFYRGVERGVSRGRGEDLVVVWMGEGVLININNKWDIQGLSLGIRRRGWEIIFILKKSKIRHFQRVFNCAGPYPYFSEKKREKKMFWELDRKDGTSWSREVKFYWASFDICGEVLCTWVQFRYFDASNVSWAKEQEDIPHLTW